MTRFLAPFLALLLAVPSFAGLLPIDLGALRPVAPVAPAARPQGGEDVKHRVELGPGARRPTTPPNLSNRQLDGVVNFLAAPRSAHGGASPELLQRSVNVIGAVDIFYKRSIPRSEWDQRLRDMKAEFVKKNGQPGSKPMTADEWEKAVDDMLVGLVKGFGDPHTAYMDEAATKRWNEQSQNTFVGIGAMVEAVPAGVKLTALYTGSPAAAAGLVPGDIVTMIDGVPTTGRTLEDAISRIRGPAGTDVLIRVQRLPLPVTVTRAAIHVADVFGDMPAPGIGRVYLSHFGDDADDRLFAEIDKLRAQGATKLVLDLRWNPGGGLDEAGSIASEFLKDKDLITTTKRQGKVSMRVLTDGAGKYADMDVVVLVNDGSASASEVVSAALQEHKKARVVGSDSYGKGSFQIPIPTDGIIIKVTEGGWYTPKNNSIEGVLDPKTGRNVPGSGGVKPDVKVSVSDQEQKDVLSGLRARLGWGGPLAATDTALAAAVRTLQTP